MTRLDGTSDEQERVMTNKVGFCPPARHLSLVTALITYHLSLTQPAQAAEPEEATASWVNS